MLSQDLLYKEEFAAQYYFAVFNLRRFHAP